MCLMGDDKDEILTGEVFEIRFETIQAETRRHAEFCKAVGNLADEVKAGNDRRAAALRELDLL